MNKKDLMRHINETTAITFKDNTTTCGILKYRDTKPGLFYIGYIFFNEDHVKDLWFQNDQIGGYIDKEGNDIICEEYGTDAEFDSHAVDIMNDCGYYDKDGKYHDFGFTED